MCSGCSKECQAFCYCSSRYTIRQDASLHWTKVIQAAVKLELQAPSLPCRHKMPSRYFEGNAQPEHHSYVEHFYRQIYLETVDTVANYIVECFNQKDYLCMQTEQILLKETLGALVHKMSTNCVSSTQSLTLIPYEFSYPYIVRVLSQFQIR